MNKTTGFFKIILTILVLGIALFSCKKDPSQIGLDLVGNDPLVVHFTDTTSVKVYSVLRDSVRTDELTYNTLGVVVDPVFGTTKADLYIQYNLSLSTFAFGDNAVLDSIVLSVPYQSIAVFGDSLAPLSFKVYQLDELMYVDSAYYSISTAAHLNDLLAEASFVPRPFDSTLVDTVMKAPHFRLPLSNQLGEYLMSFDDTIYYDNTNFVDRFKGLYFESQYTGGTGNLTSLNMYGTDSKITIYYKNDISDSLSYDLVVSAYTPSFQNYDHLDYIGSDPDFYKQVIEKDTTLGEQKFYLQTLGGVDSYISFPFLFDREDFSKYAINEAKLVITNVEPEIMFIQPNQMLLFHQQYSDVDSTNHYYYIDDASKGDDYFGGYYNSTSKQYEFRITKYLQDYLAGNYSSDQLLMQISGATYTGSRLVAAGSSLLENADSRIKLEIIYTEIDTEQQ
ncbi:MAG: DUF4270 domain-containing protein [Bacteroidales bacterium]|nr:DUF4270 domain-containing protein [Bacteroidales bacterium]